MLCSVLVVSNPGAEAASQLYSGGDDRPYNSFYAAMKSWGRYELTSAPAGADLVFKLRFINRVTFDGHITVHDPQLRLTILDPATRSTGNIKELVARSAS